jgi:PadR family transcriptional regulator PadR
MGTTPPLIKGTLDLLVMKALSCESTHGYGLAQWLERHSGGDLIAEDSARYQALDRLEGKELVRAEWGVTENNRRARYYDLTARGSAYLEREADQWSRYTERVSAILALPSAAGA